MKEETRFTIHLDHINQYEFNVKFDWPELPPLIMDEPAPLGNQNGPNASRLLAAATANCLSASLLFCLQKSNVTENSLRTEATCVLVRNDQKRLRIGNIQVRIQLVENTSNSQTRLNRCLTMFEDFCVVTASLRQGIPVEVSVYDDEGNLIHKDD